MNFEFSEEQTMIKDSVSRFVREQYDFDTRRGIIESDDGISREFWSMFAELGWLSVPFAEEYGGFGGSVIDIAAVMEEMGKGIVVEPYVSTVVVFGGLLSASTNSALKEAVIPSIIEGACLGSFAYMEPQSRYEMSDVSTAATASGDGYILNGVKTVVANGGTASKFVVSARTSGGQFDHSGVSLFLVDATAPGVEVKAYKMMDGQSAATLTLTDVAVDQGQLLNSVGEGMDLIEQVMPQILIGLSAEALGIMAMLNTLTVDYSKTRQQFGTPISSFQVLQHRMVDTFMACEQSKSMLYRGLCESKSVSEGETDGSALAKTVHALKATVARYGKTIGEEAIQLHGGIGMTDEYEIGFFIKRARPAQTLFGDSSYHTDRFAQLSGF